MTRFLPDETYNELKEIAQIGLMPDNLQNRLLEIPNDESAVDDGMAALTKNITRLTQEACNTPDPKRREILTQMSVVALTILIAYKEECANRGYGEDAFPQWREALKNGATQVKAEPIVPLNGRTVH